MRHHESTTGRKHETEKIAAPILVKSQPKQPALDQRVANRRGHPARLADGLFLRRNNEPVLGRERLRAVVNSNSAIDLRVDRFELKTGSFSAEP